MKTGELTKIHQQFRAGVLRYDRERTDLLRRAQAGDGDADGRKALMTEPIDVEKRFTYHPPKGSQPARYVLLRDEAKRLAHLIIDETPVSREQSLAITHLEQAVMWANAAIARNE